MQSKIPKIEVALNGVLKAIVKINDKDDDEEDMQSSGGPCLYRGSDPPVTSSSAPFLPTGQRNRCKAVVVKNTLAECRVCILQVYS